jgi:hypothetical protein
MRRLSPVLFVCIQLRAGQSPTLAAPPEVIPGVCQPRGAEPWPLVRAERMEQPRRNPHKERVPCGRLRETCSRGSTGEPTLARHCIFLVLPTAAATDLVGHTPEGAPPSRRSLPPCLRLYAETVPTMFRQCRPFSSQNPFLSFRDGAVPRPSRWGAGSLPSQCQGVRVDSPPRTVAATIMAVASTTWSAGGGMKPGVTVGDTDAGTTSRRIRFTCMTCRRRFSTVSESTTCASLISSRVASSG